MSRSHPAVHPVEAPPFSIENAGGGIEPPRLDLKDVQGMPGTSGSLTLRLLQSVFAILSLGVMASTSDFPSVTAFRYLVATSVLQIFWSLSLAIMDVYALLVKRSFRNYKVISLFTAGDGLLGLLGPLKDALPWKDNLSVLRELQFLPYDPFIWLPGKITSTLTFAAASASAGITVLIDNDLNSCAQNHCSQFETATGMAFMAWFAVLPSFLLNFWSLASR